MPTPFEVAIHARWPDMDQNGHMRTVAYLEVAEDSRMQYFASRGYSMDSFVRNRIGPVVTSDELNYRAELPARGKSVTVARQIIEQANHKSMARVVIREAAIAAQIVTVLSDNPARAE